MAKLSAMQIVLRVRISSGEARRLLGLPDLLPLYEIFSVAGERWCQACLEPAAVVGREDGDEHNDPENSPQ